MKVILAENSREARTFCWEHGLDLNDVVIVYNLRTVEGLRFRYEDVIRVPGWSKNPDVEAIEEVILRNHIIMSPKKPLPNE